MAGETTPVDYALEGLAVPDQLDRLHDLLDRVAADHPAVPPTDLMMLATGVMEIAGNVVEHGRPTGEVSWRFTVAVSDDALEARLADSGEEYVATWTPEMPGELAESGRGMPLAEAALHELHYAREDDRNVWTMVRRFGSTPTH